MSCSDFFLKPVTSTGQQVRQSTPAYWGGDAATPQLLKTAYRLVKNGPKPGVPPGVSDRPACLLGEQVPELLKTAYRLDFLT